jgi:hypothetical protein
MQYCAMLFIYSCERTDVAFSMADNQAGVSLPLTIGIWDGTGRELGWGNPLVGDGLLAGRVAAKRAFQNLLSFVDEDEF